MRFKSEEDAWEHWEGLYYFHGGYEPPGRNFNDRVDMFNDWVFDNDVSWIDEDLASWLDEESAKELAWEKL